MRSSRAARNPLPAGRSGPSAGIPLPRSPDCARRRSTSVCGRRFLEGPVMPKKTPYPRLRVHVRKGKAGQVWTSYYYDGRPDGQSDTALGSDYEEALKRWDEIHNHKPRIAGTLQEAFNRWREEVLPTY